MKINKMLLVTCCAAAVASAPALAGEARLTEGQRKAYLGETSAAALSNNVLARLSTTSIAPAMHSITDRLNFWHSVMLDSCAIDHTPDPVTGDVDFVQGGPTRTSRAFAMTMIAVYDAANAFDLKYNPYNDIGSAGDASKDAAIAYAAHGVLSWLYPDQVDRLDSLLASDIAQIIDTSARIDAGKALGLASADAIKARRSTDNSNDPEPSFGQGGRVATGSTDASGGGVNDGGRNLFEWEPDPVAGGDLALGAFWGGVTPFILTKGDQFRIPPPPTAARGDYVSAWNQVARVGGAPTNTGIPSTATPSTIFIGNYWGYDAVPLLGVPPRLYAQIAIQVALGQGVADIELARYLAMIHTAQADSAIAAWDSKYYYNYWRPVTGIRRDDGRPGTISDPNWEPVGVSVINTTAAVRPTPPFPAYPSGHATFGASVVNVMASMFGDNTPTTFISDEYNGVGADPFTPGVPRPLVPVRFRRLTHMASENGVSRVFNGVHWIYDNTTGQRLGNNIAQFLLTQDGPFAERVN